MCSFRVIDGLRFQTQQYMLDGKSFHPNRTLYLWPDNKDFKSTT